MFLTQKTTDRSSYIRREHSHLPTEDGLFIEHHNAIFSKKDQNLVLKRRLENGILIEETKVENFSQKEECLLSGQRREKSFYRRPEGGIFVKTQMSKSRSSFKIQESDLAIEEPMVAF